MKKASLFLVIGLIFFSGLTKNVFAIELKPSSPIELGNCVEITQVRASHILVKTQAEALKIRQEIINGKSFAQAAKEYSICPSGQEGGDLGYFCRGMMVPEFEDAAFSLPVQKLSDPLQTQFGWHLILVTDKK